MGGIHYQTRSGILRAASSGDEDFLTIINDWLDQSPYHNSELFVDGSTVTLMITSINDTWRTFITTINRNSGFLSVFIEPDKNNASSSIDPSDGNSGNSSWYAVRGCAPNNRIQIHEYQAFQNGSPISRSAIMLALPRDSSHPTLPDYLSHFGRIATPLNPSAAEIFIDGLGINAGDATFSSSTSSGLDARFMARRFNRNSSRIRRRENYWGARITGDVGYHKIEGLMSTYTFGISNTTIGTESSASFLRFEHVAGWETQQAGTMAVSVSKEQQWQAVRWLASGSINNYIRVQYGFNNTANSNLDYS